jgi:hypothetical protein
VTEHLSPARATAIARAASARLVAMVQPDGRFLYRYALGDPSFVSSLYSEARHAAAVAFLAEVEGEGWDIPGHAAAIDRAGRTLEERLLAPFGTSGALCLPDEGLIKVSASALAILAEAALEARAPAAGRRDRIARLAAHVRSQREADDDFLAVRAPGPVARPFALRDDMASGQAVLALAVAGRVLAEAGHIEAAFRSAEAFARRDQFVGRLAHWTLYALEALIAIEPRPLLVAYAGRLAAAMVADRSRLALAESTPVACETEGLLAWARTLCGLAGREAEVARLLRRVGQNLRRQLRFYDASGVFVHSAARPEVRIDYLQHGATGFLGYARLARALR